MSPFSRRLRSWFPNKWRRLWSAEKPPMPRHRKARLGLEPLEDRTLLSITGAQVAGFLSGANGIAGDLNTAFNTAKNSQAVSYLNQTLPVFANNLNSILDLGSQITSAVTSATNYLNTDTTPGDVQTVLGKVFANTNGQVTATVVSGSTNTDLTIDFAIKPTSATSTLALSPQISLFGVVFTLPSVGPITVANNVTVDVRLHLTQGTGGAITAKVVPADTSISYTPNINVNATIPSGTVAGVLNYSGSLGLSMGPTLAVSFGTGGDTNFTALSPSISVSNTALTVNPVITLAAGQVLPQITYKTTFGINLTDPQGTGIAFTHGADQFFLGNEQLTANSDQGDFVAAVVQNAAGGLLNRVAGLVPDNVRELLLGETPIPGTNLMVKDVIKAILEAASIPLPPGTPTTPIDLLQLASNILGGPAVPTAIGVVKQILLVADLAKKTQNLTQDPNVNTDGQSQGVLNDAEQAGLQFPILTDPVGTLFGILSKKSDVPLVTWSVDALEVFLKTYFPDFDPNNLQTFIDRLNNAPTSNIISISTVPNSNVHRIHVAISNSAIFDLVKKELGHVGDLIVSAIEHLGLSQALNISGTFDIQAGITAGVDDSFLFNGITANGLEDSIFINPDNIIDCSFKLDATATFPPTGPSAAFALTPKGGFKVKAPTLNDVKNAGQGAVDAVGQFASDPVGTLESALGKIASATISGNIDGSFNLSLIDPHGNNTLTAKDILNQLQQNPNPLSLVRISGDVSGFIKGEATLLGQHLGPVSFGGSFLNFGGSSVGSNGTQNGAATNPADLFAEVVGNTLYVYDNAQSSNYTIDFNSMSGKIEVKRGAAELDFDPTPIKQIIVDLNGAPRPNGGQSQFAVADGGDDQVVLSDTLPAIPVTINGSSGHDVLTANPSPGKFFAGDVTFFGGSGADEMHGGSGQSFLHGGTGGPNILIAGSGYSELYGGPFADTLNGLDAANAGQNTEPGGGLMVGGGGKDVLAVGTVNQGNFVLIGGIVGTAASPPVDNLTDTAFKTLIGGVGNDLLIAGNALVAGSGPSAVYTPILTSGQGQALLEGGPGNDTLYGGAGGDILLGGSIGGWVDGSTASGIDQLYGGDGPNTLILSNTQPTATGDLIPTENGAPNFGSGQTEISQAGNGTNVFLLGPNNATVNASAGSGNNSFLISSDVNSPSATVAGINGPINIQVGGGTGNFIFVNDSGDPSGDNVTVTNGSITGLGTITYATTGGAFLGGPNGAGILLDGGQGANTFNVKSTLSGSNTTINGNQANDVFNVGNDAGSLGDIAGTLTLTGNGSAATPVTTFTCGTATNTLPTGDTVNFNDEGDGTAGLTYTLDNTTLSRTGIANPITFNGMQTVVLNGGTHGSTINVQSTADSVNTFINGGPGPDTINVLSTGATTNFQVSSGDGTDQVNLRATGTGSITEILTGKGNDTITLSSTAGLGTPGNVDSLLGTICIEAGAGTANRLIVDDRTAGHPTMSELTNDSLIGLAPANIYYQTTGSFSDGALADGILIYGSATAVNTFNIVSTLLGSTTEIVGGAANDVFNVASDAPTDAGTLDGIKGTLTIDAAGGNANRIIISDAGQATTPKSDVVQTTVTIGGTAFQELQNFAGSAVADINYTATGGSYTDGAANDGVLIEGSSTLATTFNIQSTLGAGSTTKFVGGAANDTFDVSSDAPGNLGTLDGIAGLLTIDAAGGSANRLIVSDAGQAVNADAPVTVTNNAITGFAGPGKNVAINYTATGGNFTDGNVLDGILLLGSRMLANVFDVISTLAASTTKIIGGAANDFFNVCSDPSLNGNVAGILGTLTVDAAGGDSNRLQVSDLTGTQGHTVTFTSSAVVGFAPATIYYFANGGHFNSGGSLGEGIALFGSNPATGGSTYDIRSTLGGSTTLILGGGVSDRFEVSSDAGVNAPPVGNLDGVQGPLTVLAGSGGGNRLIVTDLAGARNNFAIVTNFVIVGFAPAPIVYFGNGGHFTDAAANDGILLKGSDQGQNTFLVLSTLAGSTTTILGDGGNDTFYVGSTLADNNGNLDNIQGLLTLLGGDGVLNQILVNDHGKVGRANYVLSPTSLVQYDLPADMVPPDPLKGVYNPRRPLYAGVDYDGSSYYFRLDGTDDVDIFNVKPSAQTYYFINGNLPAEGSAVPGGGNYLQLDTAGTTGRHLHIFWPGIGYWNFTSNTQPVYFESIQRFNHVATYASVTGNVVQVRDAETNELQYTVQPFGSLYTGPIHVAIGDLNNDGIPDLAVAPGGNFATNVYIYSGTPDAAGVYHGGIVDALFNIFSPDAKDIGLNLAIGDLGFTGVNDLVVSAGAGWLPMVEAFDGRTLFTSKALYKAPFEAFPSYYSCGVSLAVGDVNNDGSADVIAGTGPGPVAVVNIFSGYTLGMIESYEPFGNTYKDGIYVAAGDFTNDHRVDVIVSADQGYLPLTYVFAGSPPANPLQPAAIAAAEGFDPSIRAGVHTVTRPTDGGDPGFVEHVDLFLTTAANVGLVSDEVVHATFAGYGSWATLDVRLYLAPDQDGINLG